LGRFLALEDAADANTGLSHCIRDTSGVAHLVRRLRSIRRALTNVARHHLGPAPRALHGYFSRELAPALTIDSGDVVSLRQSRLPRANRRHGGASSPKRARSSLRHAR